MKMSKTINICANCGHREIVFSSIHNELSFGNFNEHLNTEGIQCMPSGSKAFKKDWNIGSENGNKVNIRVIWKEGEYINE